MNVKVSWLSAILFGLVVLVTNTRISRERLFWFDEIGTLKVIKLPDIATIWHAQNSFRGDTAPTLYVLLVRFFYHLTGYSEIAVRLLSTLAMCAALLVIFDCARRLTDGTHGLIAFCILASSFVSYYGYEGRPYALVVLFTAIALWLWLHTKPDSKAAAVAFGAAIFLDVSMHYYAVVAMVPFGVWELRHWLPRRTFSLKFLAGIVALPCALAISAQHIMVLYSVGVSPAASWSAPTNRALITIFSEFFPSGPFILAIFAILICLLHAEAKPISDSERLCWLFLTIPIAGFVVAEVATKSYHNRYLIAVAPGVAVACACLFYRHLPKPASWILLLFLVALVTRRQVESARWPKTIEPPSASSEQRVTRETLAAEDVVFEDGKRIIITSVSGTEAMRYYSKRPALYGTYGPDSDPYYCKAAGDTCWTVDRVKSSVPELAAIYPSDQFLSAMAQAGFQATLKMTSPTVVYFSPR